MSNAESNTYTEWWRAAWCAGKNPREWDTRVSNNGAWFEQEIIRASELCRKCKVRTECARDALDYGGIGTIRAGVPIPPGQSMSRSQRARMRIVQIMLESESSANAVPVMR